MAKHRVREVSGWLFPAAVTGCVALLVAAIAGTAIAWRADPDERTDSCADSLRVVTASSYAPVVSALTKGLASGADCLSVTVEAVDGRAAPVRVRESDADAWIPDDAAWAATAGQLELAEKGKVASGAVVASSPIFMVADKATAARVTEAGGTWLGLARQLTDGRLRLAVRDPGGSGEGMVGAGAVGEAVWLAEGMDASSLALAKILNVTRTVAGKDAAMPAAAGEVGLVAEHTLPQQPDPNLAVLPGTDRTALLRYTWLPTAAAAGDPGRAAALTRLLGILTGPEADAARTAAGLRDPEARGSTRTVPALTAKPFDVLGAHHVDHVFATWYAHDRRNSVLFVVDVSGSMASPMPGTTVPVIEAVRRGCRAVGELLPDDAVLGLWEFGSALDAPRDHRVSLRSGPLAGGHRQAWNRAVDALAPQRTGTGLYDTILAAYLAARDAYAAGMPNQVLVFTDGRNEDDPGSITLAQLAEKLVAAQDKQRPILLSVVAFGQPAEAELLKNALKPVQAYVDAPKTADEVAAVFIHVAAGGLHAH